MVTNSPALGLGIKVTGLTAIAAILFSASLSTGIQSSYAQFGVQTQEESQETGEQQVESDGGLTARLNGETFGRGDTVTVTGTVEERDGSASMYATIIDPAGIEISTDSIAVGSDLTFRYGFVAGEDDEMTTAGTYTVQIQYFPPGDAGIQSVTLDFEYNPDASLVQQTEQEIGTTEEATTTEPTTTFQNLTEGFRIQIPNGWVVDDKDYPESVRQRSIEETGYDVLAVTCPQNQATPQVGGSYTCDNAGQTDSERIVFSSYPNLTTKYASVLAQNQRTNITMDDLVAIDLQRYKELTNSPEVAASIRIENQIEATPVNLIDPRTNQTLQTLPTRIVTYTWTSPTSGNEYADHFLLVLADNGDTGYSIHPSFGLSTLDEGIPAEARQVFDTFDLLANSSEIQQPTTEAQRQSQQNNATTATTTTAPFSSNNITTSTNLNAVETQPPQQQEEPSSSSPFSEQLQSDQLQEQEPVL